MVFKTALTDDNDPALAAGYTTMTLPRSNLGSATLVNTAKAAEWTDLYKNHKADNIVITVPTARLDDLLLPLLKEPGTTESYRNINLMKMDTEGWELYVCRGASKIIELRLIDEIHSEFHPRFMRSAGYDPSWFMYLWHDAGYDIFPTGFSKPLAETDIAGFVDSVSGIIADVKIKRRPIFDSTLPKVQRTFDAAHGHAHLFL